MASDLIYCGYEHYEQCTNELKIEYPEGQIENASDSIHGGRFGIEIPDETQKDLRLFLLRRGYLNISLDLGLLKETKPKEFMALVKQVVSEKEVIANISASE